MKRLLFATLTVLCFLSASAKIKITAADAEKQMTALDRILTNELRHNINRRQQSLDSLRLRLDTLNPDPQLLMQLAHGYTSFNNDSALYFLEKGANKLSHPHNLPFRWKHASLLPLAGFFERAVEEFNSIDTTSIASSDLTDYYDAGRQLFDFVEAFYSKDPYITSHARRKALDYRRRILPRMDKADPEYKFKLGEYHYLIGQEQRSRAILEELVETEPETSTVRARAAHHLAGIARKLGNTPDYLYYLAISAQSDADQATREVISLQELGQALYETGDVSRAHYYLSTALENAVACGASVRMLQTARSLPVIEYAHKKNIEHSRRILYIVIAFLLLLVAGVVTAIFLLRREVKRQMILQESLRRANKIKEVYISQFLTLCSIYMDKLNQFCKIANRKLAAGQADELYRMTRSGKFIEEQSQDFYEVFDNAFLHIYPTFVEDVNALLRPDAQLETKEGELLNTDLRILAFMRLGIEESARIAQILNYSLNTIYAYRNRLKARAIDRENFEENIMKIESK